MAVQLAAGFISDPAVTGYQSTGLTFGATWFVLDTLRLGAGVTHRDFADMASMGEGLGAAIGSAIGAAFCTEVEDPQCAATAGLGRTSVQDIGLEIGIVSEWQWGAFTLGVEWLAAYQPIAILDQSVQVSGDGQAADRAAPLEVSDLPFDLRFGTVMLGASF